MPTTEIDVTSAQSYMTAALELARLAGDVALGFFRKPVAIETKKDGSPVTPADKAAESAAREWLQARWPQDGILGEEAGLSRADAARRWIIDPIDGTKTFVRGVPFWGTLVGVIEGDKVIAGAAYYPALNEHLVAGRGCGTWHNGSRCRVSDVAELSRATILTTDATFYVHPERADVWAALSRDVAVSRTWGDCYGHLLVATGRAEAMADDYASAWDISAIQVIIEEAGGVFTDWRGEHTAFGSDAIATNAALADILRARLGAGAG